MVLRPNKREYLMELNLPSSQLSRRSARSPDFGQLLMARFWLQTFGHRGRATGPLLSLALVSNLELDHFYSK